MKAKNFKLNNVSKESMNLVNRVLRTSPKNLTTTELGQGLPQDIITNVKEARLRNGSIENLIHVERVEALKGRRVFKTNTPQTGLTKINEGGTLTSELVIPLLEGIDFEIEKYRGFTRISNELLQDASAQVNDFIIGLASEETRITRNKEAFEAMDTLPKTLLNNVHSIKEQMNTTLRKIRRNDMVLVTNTDGFKYLDEQFDAAGTAPLLKGLDTVSDNFKIFGVNVEVFDNEELPTVGNKIPFIFGNLQDAAVLFDRELLQVLQTNAQDNDFIQDRTMFRIDDAFQVQVIASDLVVYGQIEMV